MEQGGIFDPLVAVSRYLLDFFRGDFRRPRITFITVHYLYLTGLTIVGSVILFPKGMTYINALFFAAGSATQSGLNPVNVNDIFLYQQIVLMMVAQIANPIFINTAVVFLRLHWFEKRFQHIVQEDKERRKSKAKTITRSKSEMREEHDLELGGNGGVEGKEIKVLHETTRPNGMSGSTALTKPAEKEFLRKLNLEPEAYSISSTPPGGSDRNSDGSEDTAIQIGTVKKDEKVPETARSLPSEPNHKFHRDITFADEITSSEKQHTQQSPQLQDNAERGDVSKHIEFLERQQRNAQMQGGTLRIPGPRDFDRGEVPKELDHDADEELHRPRTQNTLMTASSEQDWARRLSDGRTDQLNADDHTFRQKITIDEPDHPAHHARNEEHEAGQPTALQRIKSSLSVVRRRNRSHSHSSSHTRGSLAKAPTDKTSTGSVRAIEAMPYLSWVATTGRNSKFFGMTEAQREELGGIEYRALKTLRNTLVLYFFGFHILGLVVLLGWIEGVKTWRDDVLIPNNISVPWWGIFTPASMFNDLGFTLTADSMNSFETAVLPLLFGSFLIIIGNTGFPCMLRFVIWVASRLVPYGSGVWEELRFLLDHPRRCFTLLFPSRATWWLFWVLVLLNGIDLVFFIILDLNDPAVTSLAPGFRVLNGWFQAASTRTAGFSCVNIAALHPAIQVSYMIMMYISVFPIAISVRRTNVYEEKSLGIWGGEEHEDDGQEQSYVGQHLRRQLSFDLWYLFLGFFIICIVEGGRIADPNQPEFTLFAVLFEIVSAYGTVGLSLGYPNTDTSFSAQFAVISKLIVIAMMIRGRHRGLPYALDRAILLPSDNLYKKEHEEHTLHRGGTANTEDYEDETDESGPAAQRADTDVTGTGSQHPGPVGLRRLRRRSNASVLSSMSDERRQRRSRSFGQVFVGALSAGPTLPRHMD